MAVFPFFAQVQATESVFQKDSIIFLLETLDINV